MCDGVLVAVRFGGFVWFIMGKFSFVAERGKGLWGFEKGEVVEPGRERGGSEERMERMEMEKGKGNIYIYLYIS